MGTRRQPELDHHQVLSEIDRKLESKSWQERRSTIELILQIYRDVPKERTVDQLVERVGVLAADKKKEVRRASIEPLLELRRPGARNTLDRLSRDPNQWVRSEAKRAKSKLDRLTGADKEISFAYEATKDLGGSSAEKIFKTALRVGEKHYQEFAADIAHELNTYSGVVHGFLRELELELGDETLQGQTAEIFSRIQERSTYLQKLVENLLVYTRDAKLHFQWQPIKPVIYEAVEIACQKTREGFREQPVDIQIEVEDNLHVEVCVERFGRALTNFISNGFEAMTGLEAGAAQLQVRAALDENGYLELSIADTGCGMDAEQLEKNRKRFSSGRRESGGIGLGLPMAIKIIEEEHGGQLEITSEPGIGTTIVIHLSLKREQPDEL